MLRPHLGSQQESRHLFFQCLVFSGRGVVVFDGDRESDFVAGCRRRRIQIGRDLLVIRYDQIDVPAPGLYPHLIRHIHVILYEFLQYLFIRENGQHTDLGARHTQSATYRFACSTCCVEGVSFADLAYLGRFGEEGLCNLTFRWRCHQACRLKTCFLGDALNAPCRFPIPMSGTPG